MLKRSKLYSFVVIVVGCTLVCGAAVFAETSRVPELAKLDSQRQIGFAHAGWNNDAYPDLDTLKPHYKMLVADLEGPGIIKNIHCTRHSKQSKLFGRGIVLEILFDDANEPAVMCPLADFFGDGCGGSQDLDFSSLFIECVPEAYNCYFPMPFRKRARVFLRNDTDHLAANYITVEWEKLPSWDENNGYFHATYERRSFQLTRKTKETFLKLQGRGQIIGRQLSVTTDEHLFTNLQYVMEGNNEIDIDGQPRAIDYLGSEDSFGFSWGFPRTYAGLRQGITIIKSKETETVYPEKSLSVYRFHDTMPIKFDKELSWSINWQHERRFDKNEIWRKLCGEAMARNGCWIDYATVFYWYSDQPGGYKHKPLRPVEERSRYMLRSNKDRDKVKTGD